MSLARQCRQLCHTSHIAVSYGMRYETYDNMAKRFVIPSVAGLSHALLLSCLPAVREGGITVHSQRLQAVLRIPAVEDYCA